jgi:protease-4
LFGLLLLGFLAVALVGFGFILGLFATGEGGSGSLTERYHSGKTGSHNKIAIIKIEGVLVEGAIGYAEKQIEQAMQDKRVKGVVVRIDSPGGSITASEELHRRLTKLRDGEKGNDPKPIVVSMGSMAASGGYYVAMPARTIFAETTTITGSIGVYAALPNVHKGAENIGVEVLVIKAGDVKDSGSPFAKAMQKDSKEWQMWQNMIDHAYLRFIDVVEAGRPELKGELQKNIAIDETLPVRNEDKADREYRLTRYRADGGIFTAEQAKKFGLIDEIGTMDDAAGAAAKSAQLGSDYKVVQYDRPPSLLGALIGVKAPQAPLQLDSAHLSDAATPRLWYLGPQSELAGMLAVAGGEK